MSNEQKNMDIDAKAWLNITTDAANDTTKWFERDLDDFLKEIHRETEENEKDEEDFQRVRMSCSPTVGIVALSDPPS